MVVGLSLFCVKTVAQNPLTDFAGVSDPHLRVFNDTVYMFTGHDASPDDKTWVMKDWRVFASTDLCRWELVRTISPRDNYMGESSEDCWATDAATRNGKYYFYFSDQKRGIGVMQSDRPDGEYRDVLGGPLIAPHHDPTAFIDDDVQQTPYIVYGDKEASFRVVRLNDDMVSLAEEPRAITIEGQIWEEEPEWMDKSYVFKHKDTYYLSWGCNYAISDNIYGPYQCVGALGDGHNLDYYAHGSFFNWKGQFYHTWCYYLRKGYKYREVIMSYCHIDDQGRVVTDTKFLDQHFANGVGQYNASWDRIEAEWFYEISQGVRKAGLKGKGFYLTDIQDGDYVRFANVSFDSKCRGLDANVMLTKGKGLLEIRIGSPKGQLLGRIKLTENASFSSESCDLKPIQGCEDVYLVYKGDKESVLQIDWIKFSLD